VICNCAPPYIGSNDRHENVDFLLSMTSLLPSLPISFPRSPPSWYILPRKQKSPPRIHPLPNPMREEQRLSPPPPPDVDLADPLPTGEQHWQTQRKEWLSGPGTTDTRDDVPRPTPFSLWGRKLIVFRIRLLRD
jgi:hypothetical protein